ncbi:hypothetical protein CCR75_002552 [Bremia lactucae]|uniref:Vesicle transport protein n=1 Tax=Bremia lactucae TaxID=4779 RepID=A0A976FMH4_BRELC|nr:hypothetical protein CCR75_002552 [Bremia lactucae]
MMDQLKQQSKKASDKLDSIAKVAQRELNKTSKMAGEKLDDIAKITQRELEETGKKAQKSIDTAQKSINKATKQGKKASESAKESAKEAFHIDVKVIKNDKKKKAKPRRKDSNSSEEDGLLDDIGDEFDELTLNQRALGALGCYMLSGFLAFLATLVLFTSVHHVRLYSLLYSLSNVATFCSLLFIMGQDRLQKRMLSRKRSITGRAWMGSLALTIIVAFLWHSHWFIVILLLLVQFGSMIWYSATYIPFGRKFVHKYMARRVILVDALDGKIDGK